MPAELVLNDNMVLVIKYVLIALVIIVIVDS